MLYKVIKGDKYASEQSNFAWCPSKSNLILFKFVFGQQSINEKWFNAPRSVVAICNYLLLIDAVNIYIYASGKL